MISQLPSNDEEDMVEDELEALEREVTGAAAVQQDAVSNLKNLNTPQYIQPGLP